MCQTESFSSSCLKECLLISNVCFERCQYLFFFSFFVFCVRVPSACPGPVYKVSCHTHLSGQNRERLWTSLLKDEGTQCYGRDTLAPRQAPIHMYSHTMKAIARFW